MPANPPDNMPRITPYLLYRDIASILDWLCRTFGFQERMRLPGPDGEINHAELEFADGVIMVGCPGPEYRNPKRLGQVTQHLYVSFKGGRSGWSPWRPGTSEAGSGESHRQRNQVHEPG